ncbi:cysteine hydrolase family protein [Paenibacillus sp. J22TS3]|uniref:cysteine hydrolase family protein n=1 Tax=Paenibacillus sp. J22TS3 TaxID=2807192 RepID=UPI001B2C7E76|nr:cysteine hydrolase family protein [Paenibacillus sp. J22TS3]GIP21914.1 isochorismatase [Paenibacillus sp. J22TS3]
MSKALMVIDVQVGMFDEPDPVYQAEELLVKLEDLIERARRSQVPVIYVQHNEEPPYGQLVHGQPAWEIHSRIAPASQDTIIQKETPDSFFRTNLKQELESLAVNELIIAGLQTEVCVDTTIRSAFSHGYKLTLAQDAHSTWDGGGLSAKQIIRHHNRILQMFADVKNSADISF